MYMNFVRVTIQWLYGLDWYIAEDETIRPYYRKTSNISRTLVGN